MLTKETLVPIGIFGLFIVAGTWVGKVETKLEAHQLQLEQAPPRLERISDDITKVRESLARIEGALGLRKK